MSSGAVQAARPAISLDGVTKYFFQSGKRFPAIESITLDVAEGAFVSLVGPSGSGKSTVFNCIAGFVTPEVGSVTYRGERVTRPNIGIGYMTQKDTLLPWRSVLSNVMLPLRLKNVSQSESRDRAMAMLRRVGLERFADHRPRALSGGMQKRAALARTLVYNPDTLLMDEPFGNVDVQLKLQLQRELMTLWGAERKTVVFVTHDLEEAIALSDRVVVLSRGPGRIKEIVEIDLPRPRDPVSIRFEAGFQAVHHHIWNLCDTMEDADDVGHG